MELTTFLSEQLETFTTEEEFFSEEYAKYLDTKSWCRKDDFNFPKVKSETQLGIKKPGDDVLYFVGHSLGLQPKRALAYLNHELDKWHQICVDGHFDDFEGSDPLIKDSCWMNADEALANEMAPIVGAKPVEVVCMNTLSVNLHFMMVSFYRPTKSRYKILVEEKLFPSDFIAVKTQIEFHGFDPEDAIIKIKTTKTADGRTIIETPHILETIEANKDSLALIMIAGIQYYTGQLFEIEKIAKHVQQMEEPIFLGLDLAHAAGNVELKLHDWGIDFACWCTYKYLNSGPGGLGGVFVHEKHIESDLPRFGGWWSHRKSDRFLMAETFIPEKSALQYQVSNPPVLIMATLRGSLEVFNQVGMKAIREKSESLTRYFELLIQKRLGDAVDILTPGFDRKAERGAQLSLVFKIEGKTPEDVFKIMQSEGVMCDLRKPNVMRIAPIPMYTSYLDLFNLVKIMEHAVFSA